eukprot:gene19976-26687_t
MLVFDSKRRKLNQVRLTSRIVLLCFVALIHAAAGAATDQVDAPAKATLDSAKAPAKAMPDPGKPTAKATPDPEKPPAKAPAKVSQKVKRQKKEKAKIKIVEFAPEAEVEFGDDIDDAGKCTEEIDLHCEDIDVEGEGALAGCVSDIIAQSENGAGPDGSGDMELPEVSDECRNEVYAFKISRDSNINKNIPLAKACKIDAENLCNVTWPARQDAENLCNVTWFFGYKVGQVINCLKKNAIKTNAGCKKQIFKVMEDQANDIRADPDLWEACKDDADSLCKDVKPGRGRIQGCLRDKHLQLSWTCEEQLFHQEMDMADDIRLSVRLYDRCMPDKRKFCGDVEPGNSRTKECLEQNREDLSSPCRVEIDSMIERRVNDFRLDSKLRNACEDEIFNMCAYFGDLDDIDTYDTSVINCLQDYSDEISNKKCLKQVNKYVELASQDIRFDVPLAEACYEDRQKFCGAIPPGSARVIRCLSNKRESLSAVCRATLFDEEVRFSENIDFQFPMKAACKSELSKYCKGIQHGDAKAIRCLQKVFVVAVLSISLVAPYLFSVKLYPTFTLCPMFTLSPHAYCHMAASLVALYSHQADMDFSKSHQADKDFSKGCKKEVQHYEQNTATDYRLNYRLHSACKSDVQNLCPQACSYSDANFVSPDMELLYYEKMEVSDYNNDALLAEACRTDVDKFCKNVKPGEGRVHTCLRNVRKNLTEPCRKEELLLEEKEGEQIELNVGLQANWKLDPPLRKNCKNDVEKICSAEDHKDSEDGGVYKCLIRSFQDVSTGCQKEMGRAVHMAFFVWQEGAILTKDCDDDIKKYCLAVRPNMASRSGAVGSCLASIRQQDLSVLADAQRCPSWREPPLPPCPLTVLPLRTSPTPRAAHTQLERQERRASRQSSSDKRRAVASVDTPVKTLDLGRVPALPPHLLPLPPARLEPSGSSWAWQGRQSSSDKRRALALADADDDSDAQSSGVKNPAMHLKGASLTEKCYALSDIAEASPYSEKGF